MELELGLDTFGDVTLGTDGTALPQHQVIRNVVAEGVLADSVGVDFLGMGEHHRPDFAVSAPDVVLTAIAAQTSRIKLGSAVTVLSSDDPIRVFQRFATLDAISNGRAEVIVGRGSFIESFSLFGYNLGDYERLFEEKLNLFVQLLDEAPVTWEGSTREPLVDKQVYPTTEQGRLTTWVGVGGTPESVIRAAHYGLPLMIAIIGGSPAGFVPLAGLYGRALAEFGKPALPVGVHSPGHIAETDDEAWEQLWPHWQVMRNRIGAERGWGPTSRTEFASAVGPDGALYAGSPETVAKKIAKTATLLGLSRFDLKYSNGAMPHDQLMRSIELYGTRVIPMVRELMAG